MYKLIAHEKFNETRIAILVHHILNEGHKNNMDTNVHPPLIEEYNTVMRC
jgi:hypothetical protein